MSTHWIQRDRRKAESCEAFNEAKKKFIDQFEKAYVEKLLILHNGNITRAARQARTDRRTVIWLIRKHGIDLERFRTAID